jgi:hypothetical protein
MTKPFLKNADSFVSKMLKIKLTPSALNKITREKLNTVASIMGLKPEEYRTKKNLYERIWELSNKSPSSRCSNKRDPVTLDDIDNIPINRLYEWNQNGQHWGADVVSLKKLIQTGNTRLPWSIDTASGIEASEDPQKYYQKYEFSEKFKQAVHEKAQSFETNISFIDVPERSHLRFYIENLASGDMYITHIIDFVENVNYQSLCEYLNYCLIQLWEYIKNAVEEDAVNNIKSLHIVEYIFTNILNGNNISKGKRKLEGLRIVCHIFEMFKHNLETSRFEDISRLFLLQMDNVLTIDN